MKNAHEFKEAFEYQLASLERDRSVKASGIMFASTIGGIIGTLIRSTVFYFMWNWYIPVAFHIGQMPFIVAIAICLTIEMLKFSPKAALTPVSPVEGMQTGFFAIVMPVVTLILGWLGSFFV